MRFSKGRFRHLTKKHFGNILYDIRLESKDVIELNTRRYFDLLPYNEEILNNTCYVSKTYIKDCVDNLPKLGEYINQVKGLPFSFIFGDMHIFGSAGESVIGVLRGYFAFNIKAKGVGIKNDSFFWEEARGNKCPSFEISFDNSGANWQSYFLFNSISILLFKHFAELKAKQLPPKGKLKDFHCRYKSDLNIPINLLTENWYTESCQNHPFVVRGHWRMQACGEGLSERRLIYVNPFMKKGYTKGTYKDN